MLVLVGFQKGLACLNRPMECITIKQNKLVKAMTRLVKLGFEVDKISKVFL